MKNAPTSIKLDDALKDKLQRLAVARKRSAHWIMREAIREYVEREERKDVFYQRALRSWEKFQQDGLHVTVEEVSEWLRSDPDTPPPPCHT